MPAVLWLLASILGFAIFFAPMFVCEGVLYARRAFGGAKVEYNCVDLVEEGEAIIVIFAAGGGAFACVLKNIVPLLRQLHAAGHLC